MHIILLSTKENIHRPTIKNVNNKVKLMKEKYSANKSQDCTMNEYHPFVHDQSSTQSTNTIFTLTLIIVNCLM